MLPLILAAVLTAPNAAAPAPDAAPRSSGGPYVLDWYTIDGGGGTSSGGVYTLSGTIGQHDAAAPSSGGVFTLAPGFWPGVTTNDCFPDCTGDSVLNVDDIECFVTAFLGDDLAGGDCTGNGVLNVDDIECFVDAFLAGCGG
ncbi:MAG: hypothetical protein DHS20C14_17840 [Phycisphaeraceae bacterium]|nr:MAG: hypothetical protein DHS20C14_17840 [Phycisphaeraceae bacterium]